MTGVADFCPTSLRALILLISEGVSNIVSLAKDLTTEYTESTEKSP